MKKKVVTLESFTIKSFVTTTRPDQILGGVGEPATYVSCTYSGPCA